MKSKLLSVRKDFVNTKERPNMLEHAAVPGWATFRKCAFLAALLYGVAVPLNLSAQGHDEVYVAGTPVNVVPSLPYKVKIAGHDVAVKWDKAESYLFNSPFKKVYVKGTASVGGKNTTVEAGIWTLPNDLVYLVDAGRSGSNKSQIYMAAKSLYGGELLNSVPDQKASADSPWGYLEQGTDGAVLTNVTAGKEDDWASSYISDGDNKGKGLKYKFTLQPGIYRITVAHLPHTSIVYSSALRVNNALKNTKSFKNMKSEDGVHNPTFVTHDLRILKPTVVTYETKETVVGDRWNNAAISLIAVEMVSSNTPVPLFSTAGGSFWVPTSVSLSNRDKGAAIYYTLDGSKPTASSEKYTAPINIDKTTRVNAIAYVGSAKSKVVTADFFINKWAATATPFKLVGGKGLDNVKVSWAMRPDATSYKVYRDGQMVGEVAGDVFDDYGLSLGKTYKYYVEAYKDGQKVAVSESQDAATFAPEGASRTYDNLDGKSTGAEKSSAEGFKIGNAYYLYGMERDETAGWILSEKKSKTGMKGTWSKPRTIATYDGNLKFEGNAFKFNAKTGKVVFSSHYEDQNGYTAAKIFLAQITPGGGIEVGTKERPLGYESRDQSLYIDSDGSAYLLTATRNNSDIAVFRLDSTWTKPVSLVNTLFVGQHRETPAVVKKDGTYYFFSSRASGWYPSQTKYATGSAIDGIVSPLFDVGNSCTFDSQANNIQTRGKQRTTYALWSYHWGAQREHKSAAGNFPKILPVSFNDGFASMDYYRYLEFNDKYGIIPVQNGRNLTLGAKVVASVNSESGVSAQCVTDGADMESSAYFTGANYPYSLTVDMAKPSQLSEINLALRLVNGSEAAVKYTIEGSLDGKSFKTIKDGTGNWEVGYIVLPIDDPAQYRYLKLTVMGATNVHKNNAANWAAGVYEFTAFGKN